MSTTPTPPTPNPQNKPPKKIGNDGTVFRCPLCRTVLANADVPSFPFCSERCRLIDLSNWIDGNYKVTRPIDPTDHNDPNS